MRKKYGVWCEVSGGPTGYRESWMKSNGKVVAFATFAEAAEVAAMHNQRTMSNPFRTADFNYTVLALPNRYVDEDLEWLQ